MTRQFPVVPLGHVAELIRGVTFKPEDLIDSDAEGAVVCFRTANIQQVLQTEDVIAVPASFVRRAEQQIRQGDILLSSANSWELVGKCVLVPQLDYPATAGGFISIVRGLPNKVEPRYLFRWMASPATQFLLRRCGRNTTNISNLDVNRFLELPFPNAPLPEQRRVADILDEADALRRKRAEAIRLANNLTRSLFLWV
jgi:type I restriction enzyme S subunit